MDIFSTIILIIAIVGSIAAMIPSDPSDERLPVGNSPARITLEEAARINQIAHMRYLNLDLAVQLANRLTGDAWLLAQSGICPALLLEGREAQALELLARLDDHHRDKALHEIMNNLIKANEEPRALALLSQLGRELPQTPLQRIALLHASDKQAEAQNELQALLPHYPPADDSNAVSALLALARLQHRLGQTDSAIQTLQQTWQEMHSCAEEQDYLGLIDLAAQLAQLEQFQTLQDIAAQLPNTEYTPLIAELTRAGQFDQAHLLLQGSDELFQNAAYETLIEAMLEHGQLHKAEELLAASKGALRTRLLLCIAQWHLQRDDITRLNAFIEAQVQDHSERSELYLSLWQLHHQDHPHHAAALLDGAECWHTTEELFYLLEARLTQQSQLPTRERNSYEVRRGLDDMARLAPDEDGYTHISNLICLAKLLGKLERKADALKRLEEAHQLMLENTRELDRLDVEMILTGIASAYLSLNELKLACITHEERLQHAPTLKDNWTVELIRNNHLELAIDSFDFADLHSSERPLNQLSSRIKELAENAPGRSKALQADLLAKLETLSFWQRTLAS
jgi:hypothetical protein